MHSKHSLQVPSDSLLQVMVEVDYAESEYQEVVLAAVPHKTPVLALEHIRKVVYGEARPLKHLITSNQSKRNQTYRHK
jgi:hypothetical protein